MDAAIEVPPPPGWARLTAHAVVLVTLPSGLWRLAMALALPVGFSAATLRDLYGVPGLGSVTIAGISVAQEFAATLTLGLVKPWGEVLPRWLPLVGGRPVHPLAAVLPAATGATILTLAALSQLLLWNHATHTPMSSQGRTVMGWCYLPLVLWGPLLAATTVSYHRRHRRRPR